MSLNIHQKISLAVITAILMLSMYDVLFHFLLWLLHILFESAEYALDMTIEHLFDIGNRETQIIVFYLLMALLSGSIYKLYRQLPSWTDKLKQRLIQQVYETFMQWEGLSMLGKIAWWSFFLTAFNCWLFLA